MRTTLWRYHLGGGCVLALADVYLPFLLFAAGEAVGFVAGSLGRRHRAGASVAEGVEHPEQTTALAELGCHLAQGFHSPAPPEPPIRR
ncbi:MAG: hypothetical protein ACJ74K_02470 [Actinomycetes bacterium]